jgi:starch phosphorylase
MEETAVSQNQKNAGTDKTTAGGTESAESLKKAILNHLYYTQGRASELATPNDWYMAVAHTVRDRMMQRWVSGSHHLSQKEFRTVAYLSAEFLMGPHLGNALLNLGIGDQLREAVEELGLNLPDLMAAEEEPGLGNGGLGRLAACYMDSLATLSVAAIGYGIRYEYGIFDQEIRDGWQAETTDKWLSFGNPWEIPRPEIAHEVSLGGHTECHTDEQGLFRKRWVPGYRVKGIAYDTAIPGYKNAAISLLRLWRSEAVESFDFQAFNTGDYYGAVHEKVFSETLSKVLYPNDEPEVGKKLRLGQQHFFVSCSLQDALRIQKVRGLDLDCLHKSFAFQLNDTHPSIAVAELMRLLVDEHFMDWDQAWHITKHTFSYTNHTLLPEALEKWPVSLFTEVLPRHMEIVYEINRRFLEEVGRRYPGDNDRLARMSIIDEKGKRYVRMAHLAVIGSQAVNGVAELHTELVKETILRDFYELYPDRFINVTNGVTPRRWMALYNPRMAGLITGRIGDRWITRTETDLKELDRFAEDGDFQKQWRQAKRQNKGDLAALVRERTGTVIDPESLFDIQVKRIHEYKRQHLNILHVVTLYNRIKRNPGMEFTPRTVIFGGKAAPGYFMAKLIIKLINSVGAVVNDDPDVAGRLKVVFFPDFNVKNSEWIYRAADLSEQISTAGKEASGTGNMKFSMNGALTIGTLDGANIEIREEVGAENFFLFGLTAQEVADTKAQGYCPADYCHANRELKEAMDLIASGAFSRGDKELFRPLLDSLLNHDDYLLFADYQSYIDCQDAVSRAYRDREGWARMSIRNVARMGKFSSDRSVREYCGKIWRVSPVEPD